MNCLNYQLLVEDDTAVLSINGALENWTVAAMLQHCRALPSHVMTLRIDLRALGTMTADATSAVREVLGAWREGSAACFQLSTSYLVATCQKLNSHADLLRTARFALAKPVREMRMGAID